MNIRMKGVFSSCALLGIGMLASNLAHAAVPDVAAEVQYGTLGLNAQVIAPITPDRLRVRVGVNGAHVNRSYSDQNANYDMKMKLDTASALLDFHPFAGAFRVSGGLFYNNNSMTLTGSSANGSYTFNNNNYTAAQVGTLTGKWTFNKTVPYLGIGLGNAVGKDKRLSFSSDLGILFQGSPHVTLTYHNTSNAQLNSDLKAQQQKMQDDAKNFKYWPVISFGVAYKF